MSGWHAILLAGQRPGIDPLGAHFGQRLKALIPVAGKPMLVRCLETLLATPGVGQVTVLAQEPEALRSALPVPGLADDPRIHWHESQAGIAHSVIAEAKAGGGWPIVLTTADHPLLQPSTVEDFLLRASEGDLAVGVVERGVVLSAFPDNRRTWLHFRGGSWTGANLFALNRPQALRVLELWADIEQHRKKGWRMIARFGPMLLLRTLTRTISLDAAIRKAGERMGVEARAVPLADPLAAVDVDKVSDHALAEDILSRSR